MHRPTHMTMMAWACALANGSGAQPAREGRASSMAVMSAWPWKAARESRPTPRRASIAACVRRASAHVQSAPPTSNRSAASPFLCKRQGLWGCFGDSWVQP